MHHVTRIVSIALLLTLAATLGACSTSGGSSELTPDETAVPEGMPVMYEFYTTT